MEKTGQGVTTVGVWPGSHARTRMSMTTNDERLPKPTVDTQACGAARRPSPIISHFPHARTNRPDGAVTMANVIDQIRAPSPETAALIARIRAEADKAKRRGLKQDLPAVTFGARFETVRRATAPYLPSRWTVVDVDGIDQSTAVVLRARALPGCKLAFLSPSARGVKFVVEVDPTPTAPDEHKAATIAVMEAYAAALGHEVDPSGKDVTRLCFLSHDPDLVVHEGGTPFSWCPPLQDVGNGGRRPLVTVAELHARRADPERPQALCGQAAAHVVHHTRSRCYRKEGRAGPSRLPWLDALRYRPSDSRTCPRTRCRAR